MSFRSTMLSAIAATGVLVASLSTSIAAPLAPTSISEDNEIIQVQHHGGHHDGHFGGHHGGHFGGHHDGHFGGHHGGHFVGHHGGHFGGHHGGGHGGHHGHH